MTDALDVASLTDAELTRLAYRRATTPAEHRRAESAARELAHRRQRQGAEAAVERADLAGPTEPTDETEPARDARAGAARVPPWYRRPLGAVVGIVALIVAGAALEPLTRSEQPAPGALDIFERPPTEIERQHTADLLRVTLSTLSGARVLASIPPVDVVGYLAEAPSVDGSAVISSVCAAIIRDGVVLDWQCIENSAFATGGLRSTFVSIEGTIDVDWGPRSPAAVVAATPDAAAPRILDLISTEELVRRGPVFTAIAESGDELTAGPVVVAESPRYRVVLYLATAADIDDGQRLCLMAVDESAAAGTPVDGVCAPQSLAERAGLQLSYIDGNRVIDVRVSATGDVRLTTLPVS